ncbi:MAG: TIGR02646 family protein [Azonexus sp.]|nr:retron system putative HNH endonuclease [Azonexus sp.]MCK6410949.1 TIGR02646 family protein [Azonexus sp.]
MRHIAPTGNGPRELAEANHNPPSTAEEATRCWDNFRHTQKIIERLLEDQYLLCCYSELRADLRPPLGYHIEHIENKSQAPQRTFEWANLAGSALDSKKGLSFLAKQREQSNGEEINFGGHANGKQNAVDMAQFISIRDPGCASYFSYISDGKIRPNLRKNTADQARAAYTIQLLNLNSPFLLVLRRQLWDDLTNLIISHEQQDWSLEHLCMGELLPYGRRTAPHYLLRLNEFFSLTRQLFGPIADAVLQAHAPQLR